MNAKRFIEFCDAENLKFNDIILTGSLANYNYNNNSDLDVHVVLDFNQISENKEFIGDFFKMKKHSTLINNCVRKNVKLLGCVVFFFF